jgi:hypothetical protein
VDEDYIVPGASHGWIAPAARPGSVPVVEHRVMCGLYSAITDTYATSCRNPLRTGQDTFASSGSSLSLALYRTRLHHRDTLAMHLLMTCGVEQDSVIHRVSTAMTPPNDMVVVPAGLGCDWLLAHRTLACLLLPEREKLPLSPERVLHLEGQTPLKIELPCRVKRVCALSYFDMPPDRGSSEIAQIMSFPVDFPKKDPRRADWKAVQHCV